VTNLWYRISLNPLLEAVILRKYSNSGLPPSIPAAVYHGFGPGESYSPYTEYDSGTVSMPEEQGNSTRVKGLRR
jgi:hypothetical protein